MKRINYVKKTKMLSQSRNSDFFLLARQMMARMHGECRPKTVYNCQTALRALQRYLLAEQPFMNGRLPLRCLTPDLVADFCRHLARRGVTDNTVREYLRSLRSLVNRCIKCRMPLRADLFSGVSTSPVSTDRVSLSECDLRRICAAQVKPGGKDERTRDLAVFSYLAGGIPFADLARLKTANYDAGTHSLTYRRHKTGIAVRVHLTAEARRIWLRHGDGSSLYHFGLIESPEQEMAEKEYANALAAYNRRLRCLTARCGVGKRVTSYTLRHTFATVARHTYGAPLDLLSLSLGHRSERTTALYVDRPTYDMLQRLQCKMERNLMK